MNNSDKMSLQLCVDHAIRWTAYSSAPGSLADPRGGAPGTSPLRVPILSFWNTIFSKCGHNRLVPPLTSWRPLLQQILDLPLWMIYPFHLIITINQDTAVLHAVNPHWRIYIGRCPAHTPLKVPILSFWHTNFRNITTSGVHAPSYEVHASLREILDPPLILLYKIKFYIPYPMSHNQVVGSICYTTKTTNHLL